jgi:hypothetical protein
MKKIIFAGIMIISLSSFAQQINFEQVKAIKERKEIPNDDITQYTASNGSIIKIGDKFRINRPEGGAKTFVSITNKRTALQGFDPKFIETVNTSMSNTDITVKSIYIIGSRKLGFKTLAELRTCDLCNNLLVDIELAIETKEIRTNGMTSEEAISLLKSEKEKLDLGIITQSEFDSKKAELIKYINKR